MKFYRYEVEYGSEPRLVAREFKLIEETPKGYWIALDYLYYKVKDKWIPKSSKKRYAYPDKEAALINYIKRTEKRLSILKHQIEMCELGLKQANELP